ncbi:MAG: hypothetical protein IJ785_03645 [Bacteroidales bacterium]|nr:hypothetical protein [Bacteroidales bacterium]
MEKETYTTPRVKVVHFRVEHGFEASPNFSAGDSSTIETTSDLFGTEAISQNGDVIGRDALTRY